MIESKFFHDVTIAEADFDIAKAITLTTFLGIKYSSHKSQVALAVSKTALQYQFPSSSFEYEWMVD